MKLRPVSKLDKINMTTSKKFYDDVMQTNSGARIGSHPEAGFQMHDL